MKKIKIFMILALTLSMLIIVVVPAFAWHYPIDIHPYSFPNNINLKSNGRMPVAVLSYCDDGVNWEASRIMPDTVTFAGASPVTWSMQDVDGICELDLVLHFNTQELQLNVGDTEAELCGWIDHWYWEEYFCSTDSVRVRD